MAPEEEEEQMSDNDVSDNVHNRLLGAISSLYKQKRVKAPVRKESSFHVSEFHLTGVRPEEKKNEKINISELARVLEKRSGHTKINEQIKSVRSKTRKLPKPLEKPEAERLERSVGYDNLRKDLNKWDSIVYHQRVAEQVSFPLREPKMLLHKNPNDFLTTFKTPTELELKLAESLNSSELLKKEKEEEELEHFKLSLQEIKEQRSMMARLRAQLSYKESKLARQNRIKSKKFHRFQRKDRLKMQIKEFEELQKTDPEAALKKLELLEKARAQERASLRHRTTGQWARNLSVRAKYDKEARVALSEQLAKSRELTQKLKADNSSDDENISEDGGDDKKERLNEVDNSWLSKESINEVEQFYESFKKYEKEKEKNKEIIKMSSMESLNETNKTLSNNKTSENDGDNESHLNKVNLELSNSASKCTISNGNTPDLKSFEINSYEVQKKVLNSKSKKLRKASKKEVTNNDPTIEVEFSVLKKSPLKVISVVTKSRDKSKKKPTKNKLPLKSGPWSVIESKGCCDDKHDSVSKNRTKRKRSKLTTNSNSDDLKFNKRQLNFDDLFYEVEEKLSDSVKNKVKQLKGRILETERSNDDNSNVDLGDDDNPVVNKNENFLEIKRQRIQADIDEELVETPSSNLNDESQSSVQKIVANSSLVSKNYHSENNKKSANIEPNNFFYAKTKRLNSELPSSFAGAEDKLDDSDDEDKTNEKSITIAEAFACDDVDAEFKQDKEEEIKQSQVEDVNLVLPGWGSWGGANIQVSKRKKRRFIVTFPQQMPRRDENKGNVVINEDKDEKIKPHMVTELPFPFTSVKDYEASIRVPIGRTWLPQTAHRKLIAPGVTTKLGTVIEPMTKDQILKNKADWK